MNESKDRTKQQNVNLPMTKDQIDEELRKGVESTIRTLVWGYTRRMNNSTERSVNVGNL